MIRMFKPGLVLFLILLAIVLKSSIAQAAIDEIPVVIKANDKSQKDDQELLLLKADSDRIKVSQLYDLQYGKKHSFQAINLFEQIVPKARNTKLNAALLIFNNGMVVPMPLNSSQGPIVYLAWQLKDESGKWGRDFPVIAKQSVQWRDPRPITFDGNKVVISEKRFFPTSLWNTKEDFNPFNYTSSLVRIELVHYQSYIHQFAISGKAQAIKGQKVFENRCQFCHSVRGVGAHFGWDFVEPLKLYEKRSPDSLFYHVKFPKNKALEKGLMMPQQNSMTKEEASNLWNWMKEAASHPPQPYKVDL